MKIIKENSYDIIRLYVNQLGIMIFSMLLYSAVSSIGNESLSSTLSLAVSIFSTCFYFVLIYYVMWEIGAKDKIRIDGGRMEPCKHKGLVMGLCANTPNVLIGLLTVIFLVIFMLSGNAVINSIFFTSNLLMRFHAAMYLDIITSVVPSSLPAGTVDYTEFLIESILFVVIPLLSAGVTHLAYYLGSNEKKIFSFLTKKSN